MKLNTFEIKVALLGNVSAGKTTVLNALFKNKYGEVSMKRTTAGVNYFRVLNTSTRGEEGNAEPGSTQEQEQKRPWCPHAGETRTAASTLEEITKDNRLLRESNQVQEKWFDIELDDPLMEMREDTHLVVVDVPGINEAGIFKYKNYVNAKWTTFDCIIAILDGKQGLNTDDQVQILTLIQDNLISKRKYPLLFFSTRSTTQAIKNKPNSFEKHQKRLTGFSQLQNWGRRPRL